MRLPSLIEPVDKMENGQIPCENFGSVVEIFRYRDGKCVGSQPSGLIALSPATGELMTLPCPSDYCWVIGSTPQGRWIAPVLSAAVESEWKQALRIATTHLGDQTLAAELMELAIRQTAEYLAELSPVDVEDVRPVLLRFYRNAVRRRQNASKRLSFRGTATELEVLLPSVESASKAVESKVDLSIVLRETPVALRKAMLLRYGARSTWREVAQEMSKSEEAVRKSCQRELNRIRVTLGLKERAK